MHELGICDALLKMVRGVAKEQALQEIQRITVGTELEGVEFVIEELEGTARCLDCGREFPADVEHLRCPSCGSEKLTPMTGRDLTLKEILVP